MAFRAVLRLCAVGWWALPTMADVINPWLNSGKTQAKMGSGRAASILRLADRWGIDAATVKPAQSTDDDLADFLGDFGAWVTFGGRLVALNVDGTRCAMRE